MEDWNWKVQDRHQAWDGLTKQWGGPEAVASGVEDTEIFRTKEAQRECRDCCVGRTENSRRVTLSSPTASFQNLPPSRLPSSG